MNQQLLNANQIKEMMNINTWRELSGDKVMQLANSIVALPYGQEKEIILERLRQFPIYADVNKQVCMMMGQFTETAMRYNHENMSRVSNRMDSHMDALRENLKNADTPEERSEIRREMSDLEDKAIEHDKENKNFILNMLGYLASFVGVIVVGGLLFAGVNASSNSKKK